MHSGTSPLKLVMELRVEASLESALQRLSTVNRAVDLMRQMGNTVVSSNSIDERGTLSLDDGSQLSWVVTLQPSSSIGNTPCSGLSGPSEEATPGHHAEHEDWPDHG